MSAAVYSVLTLAFSAAAIITFITGMVCAGWCSDHHRHGWTHPITIAAITWIATGILAAASISFGILLDGAT